MELIKNYHPNTMGYIIKVKVSSKVLKIIFPKRGKGFYEKLELYYKPKGCVFLLVSRVSLLGKILATILLPFAMLFSIRESKETLKYYIDNVLGELEKGKYSCDTIYLKTKQWSVLNDILQKQFKKEKNESN